MHHCFQALLHYKDADNYKVHHSLQIYSGRSDLSEGNTTSYPVGGRKYTLNYKTVGNKK